MNNTPTLGLSGTYVLEAPYVTIPGKHYTCESIRSFRDVSTLNTNVFESFYEPYGISYERYKTDLDNGTRIVVLVSDTDVIYVPDSFITNIPYTGKNTYKRYVIGVDLGPLPEGTGVDHVKATLKSHSEELLGYAPDVKVAVMSYDEDLTEDQVVNIEALRKRIVDSPFTLAGRLKQEQERNRMLVTKIERMQAMINELKK